MPFTASDPSLIPPPLRLGRSPGEEYDLVEVPLHTDATGTRSPSLSPRPPIDTASSAGSFNALAQTSSDELTTRCNTLEEGAWAHARAYWPAYLLAASLAGGVGTLAWQVATNSDMRASDQEGSWLPRRHVRDLMVHRMSTGSEVSEELAQPISSGSLQEEASTMGMVPPQELDNIVARAAK